MKKIEDENDRRKYKLYPKTQTIKEFEECVKG
jgi:hypothetical protein